MEGGGGGLNRETVPGRQAGTCCVVRRMDIVVNKMNEETTTKKETIELYRNDQEMIVDAFDRVVVELFRENQKHGYKSFMICSCNAGVGSTSISMELAISLAVSGWNTVLIDGDLRKENRYKRRNQKVKYGLSDYIINGIGPEEILYPTNWEGLHYISCGHREDETPVKLLCSQKMSELAAYLKERYDFVIFDVPALNSAPDAAIVGGNADCAFLVAASSETKFHDLETARKQLEDGGVRLLGVILNRVPPDDYRHYMEDYNYFSDKEYLKRSRYYRQETKEEKPKGRASLIKFIRKLLCCLALCGLLVCTGWSAVRAAEESGASDTTAVSGTSSEVPVVMLEGYRTDGPVVRGKEFTLSFTVKNMDPDMEVRGLKIGIYASDQGGGFFLAQGKTNQIYVDRLPAGATYDGAFALQAMESLSAELIPLEIRCEYTSAAGSGTNSVIISPAVSDLCEVGVISLVTPERAVTGAKAFFSIQYENSGLAELSRLTMRVHGNVVSNDEEIDLAIPAPGRQEYAENSVIFTDAGSQELDVYLSYADADGVEYELGPLHAVTYVLSDNSGRDVYGTDIAWGEEDRRLVRRTDFMSVLQKIQQEYAWAVVVIAALLLADSFRRVVRMHRRGSTAKEGKKDEL